MSNLRRLPKIGKSLMRAALNCIRYPMSGGRMPAARSLAPAINTSPDLAFIKDAGGFYRAANQEFSNLCGIPRPLLLRLRDVDFPDEDVAYEAMEARRRVARGETLVVEVSLPHQTARERRTYQGVLAPIRDAEGRTVAMAGFGQDVTRLDGWRRGGSRRMRGRVLLISIDGGVILRLSHLLKAWGTRVDVAVTEDAAEIAKAKDLPPPDAVLLDHRLPEIRPADAMQAARSAWGRDVPGILVLDPDQAGIMELGSGPTLQVIPRPVTPDRLSAALAAIGLADR